MGLTINHNMPALFAAWNLDQNYSRLAVNTERLSSGLRIGSPKDDPAGYGIRELMRTDLQNKEQGMRNTADAISLLQTADAAMAIIDEKLVRMRELATQAATGTFTTLQREIINSEYQLMAAEIDRIANATEFNGIKLLDGSINDMHHGQGLKVHFGARDLITEDYYFIKVCDLRATVASGLSIGGDAKNDIWSTGSMAGANAADGCCGGGIPSLTQAVSGWTCGSIFAYGYNWDLGESTDTELNRGRYIGGAYQIQSGATLQSLLDQVNRGTQSRVRVDFRNGETYDSLVGGEASANENAHRICIGDEIYYFGSAEVAKSTCENPEDYNFYAIKPEGDEYSAMTPAEAFAHAVNENSDKFWAKAEDYIYEAGYRSVYIFSREGGNHDDIFGTDDQIGAAIGGVKGYASAIVWYNDETETAGQNGSYFGNGGESWGVLKAQPNGYGAYNLSLIGRDAGQERDLWILNAGSSSKSSAYDINFYRYGGSLFGGEAYQATGDNWVTGLNRETFTEVQNASDGDWVGAGVRTQSAAQEALEGIDQAIAKKEACRSRLGAYLNRLENTLTNLEGMHATLQVAESQVSDVNIATEMTDFVRNQVLSQAAVAILSQANALPEMALSLLNG
jgi:flagellin